MFKIKAYYLTCKFSLIVLKYNITQNLDSFYYSFLTLKATLLMQALFYKESQVFFKDQIYFIKTNKLPVLKLFLFCSKKKQLKNAYYSILNTKDVTSLGKAF